MKILQNRKLLLKRTYDEIQKEQMLAATYTPQAALGLSALPNVLRMHHSNRNSLKQSGVACCYHDLGEDTEGMINFTISQEGSERREKAMRSREAQLKISKLLEIVERLQVEQEPTEEVPDNKLRVTTKLSKDFHGTYQVQTKIDNLNDQEQELL